MKNGVRRTGPRSDLRFPHLTLCSLGLLCGVWLARLRLTHDFSDSLRSLFGGELLFDLGRDCGHVHLVELGGFAQGFGGFVGTVRRLQDNDCHQYPAKGAFVCLAKKGRKQFCRGVFGSDAGLADAVKPKDDRHTALVQDGGEALGDKEQVALHQADGDRIAGCFQDAKAGRLSDGLLAAALLLLCLECRVRRGPFFTGMVDWAFWIRAHLVNGADVAAFGNDGIGGEPAHLELRALCIFLFWGLVVADRGVLVAR